MRFLVLSYSTLSETTVDIRNECVANRSQRLNKTCALQPSRQKSVRGLDNLSGHGREKLAGEQAIGRVIERALVLPDNLMCDADGHKHRTLVELVLRKRRGGRNEPQSIARKRGNG